MDTTKWVQLSEIAALITKGTTPTTIGFDFQDTGINFLKIECFSEDGAFIEKKVAHISEGCHEKLKRSQLEEGDILFSIAGAIGRVAVVMKEMLPANTNQALAIIRIRRKDVYLPYIKLILTSPIVKTQFERKKQGVAQLNISLKDINELEIPLLTINKQIEYASLFDKVSRIIVARKQQLQKLDELIKSRFVEMFGDVIHNEKGWQQHSFSEITSSRLGKMLDAKQQTGLHSYPYLANFNVQWFRFELKTLNQMDFNEADRVEFALQDGDVLVCEGGEIGRCAVWHNEIQPCFFQKALHRVRCNKSIILPDYLAWWFKYNCDHGGFAAIEGAKATISHLPGAKLKQLQVTVPPISHQERFAAFVAEVDKSKLAVKQSLEKLETLKKSLMQQYFG